MTALALRNPIAVLMVCIGLDRVRVRRHAAHEGRHVPRAHAARARRRHAGAGPRPEGRREDDLVAHREVRERDAGRRSRREQSRNNLSIVFVWLKWGTDLNSAQTLVQQQAAFAMAAVPKSLGVLPPFVLQYDPSNAPVVQVAVSGGGLSGPQLYDYAFNNIEPLLEGIPGVASAALNGGRQRQINIVVDPVEGAGARHHVGRRRVRGRAVERALAVGRAHHARSSTRTSTRTRCRRGRAQSATRSSRCATASAGAHPRRRARRGRRRARDAVGVGQRQGRGLPQRAPRPRRQHARDRRRGARKPSPTSKTCRPACRSSAIFDQSTFVRTTYNGLKKEVVQALVLIAHRHPDLPAERARHARSSRSRSRCRSRSRSSSCTRRARR